MNDFCGLKFSFSPVSLCVLRVLLYFTVYSCSLAADSLARLTRPVKVLTIKTTLLELAASK